MNIWILNHYAGTPEQQVTRSYDIGRELVVKGHRVTIFASSFNEYNFTEMRLKPGEKSKAEDYDGVRFIWLKTTPYRANEWRRVVNMMSYAWRAFWVGKYFKERPDVIIGVSVHPLAALSAYILSKFKKSRFFFEVTDLWPQYLVELGRLSRKSPITWALRVLENFLYNKAERIIPYWPHVDDYIAELGISKDKVVWIPHGVDFSRYEAPKEYDGGVSKTFTIMYLGAHVSFMAMDVILKAAKIVQSEGGNHIRFVFVGGGAEKPNLQKLAADIGLHNTAFRDMVPKSEIPKVMDEADALIWGVKDIPLLQYGVSTNKVCDYLASGRPIIFAGNPKKNPVEEARAGITVPPENPEALAEAITQLVAMKPEERIQMGKNGLEYVSKHHDIRVLADRLEGLL
ncbi:glycosyltransferase family 4 protein [Chloroflexota bacterium]